MLGFKSKSASTGGSPQSGLFVVVQTIVGADPETAVGKPWTYDEAHRIVAGVVRYAPAGTFDDGTGNSIRIVSVTDWNQALVAEAVLQS